MKTIEYIIRPGDTLFDLSLKFNVPVSVIAERNNISDGNMIVSGQTLQLPVSEEVYNVYMLGKSQVSVPSGDSAGKNCETDFSDAYRRHKVRRGDTVYLLAKEFGTTASNILALNPRITDVRNIPVGSIITVPVPPENSYIYVVRPGDTVYGIARAHGVSPEDIMRYNYIEESAALLPGTQLVIVKKTD